MSASHDTGEDELLLQHVTLFARATTQTARPLAGKVLTRGNLILPLLLN